MWCRFVSENKEEFEILKSNGKARFDAVELDRDIVSKWEETIDEKKLQKLAEECTPKMLKEEGDTNEFEWGFKAGYRKAKED